MQIIKEWKKEKKIPQVCAIVWLLFVLFPTNYQNILSFNFQTSLYQLQFNLRPSELFFALFLVHRDTK